MCLGMYFQMAVPVTCGLDWGKQGDVKVDVMKHSCNFRSCWEGSFSLAPAAVSAASGASARGYSLLSGVRGMVI